MGPGHYVFGLYVRLRVRACTRVRAAHSPTGLPSTSFRKFLHLTLCIISAKNMEHSYFRRTIRMFNSKCHTLRDQLCVDRSFHVQLT